MKSRLNHGWRDTRNHRQRRGLTLIEMLVVMFILGILLAVTSIDLVEQRGNSRRTHWLNNMRNVSLAMQRYATDHQGNLPPLTDATMPLGSGFGNRPANWSVQLLPYLDQTELYERVQSVPLGSEAGQLGAINIEVFTCADDPLEEASGRLSFVVNAGFMTESRWRELNNTSHAVDAYDYCFDGAGVISAADRQVTFATGVFWRADANTPPALRTNLVTISRGDGGSQTMMLSENLDTRPFNVAKRSGGWSSDATGDIAFAIPVAEAKSPSVVADYSVPGGFGVTGSSAQRLESTALVPSEKVFLRSGAINSLSKATAAGQSPRPRSVHPNVVNTIFCDGSGKTLVQYIDPHVYVRLVTHDGNRFGQNILSATDY